MFNVLGLFDKMIDLGKHTTIQETPQDPNVVFYDKNQQIVNNPRKSVSVESSGSKLFYYILYSV